MARIGLDLLKEINAAAKAAGEIWRCNQKELNKHTKHGKQLPSHSKHNATIKKGRFP
jgi:hypothetical protein